MDIFHKNHEHLFVKSIIFLSSRKQIDDLNFVESPTVQRAGCLKWKRQWISTVACSRPVKGIHAVGMHIRRCQP